jgi:NhaP-type Na+/H+ or K+/H+ antiporter/mannitol/fructose-specific phosphotransferase system IIA component (Ntr-type)
MTLASTDHEQTTLVTMVAAITVGVALIVVSRRLKFPAIVLLLGGGILLGPTVMGDHALVQPDALGGGLRVLVGLAVGLILFEGGLTLNLAGYRQASSMIRRLLSLGVLVTWLGTALAIRFIVGLPWDQSIASASLVIVTGPTVIAPLLRRIRLESRLHNIMHWEGVLIDPIGVLIILLCFEFLEDTTGQAGAILDFVIRVVSGMALGLAGGVGLTLLVRRKVIPDDMLNVSALAAAVLIFGLAEMVRPEAGLLAVTVAGFVFGLSQSAHLKQVRQFKAELIDLLIGMLFILLAARLSFEQFQSFGLRGALLVIIVLVVIRPLNILLCSLGLDFNWKEKAFLGWIAPRGIVAASMASLIAIRLENLGTVENPKFVETFTYSVIICTIVLHGLSAAPLARALGLTRPDPIGWLIVGAHAFARQIAQFISRVADLPVLLIDTNARAVTEARRAGLKALVTDARDPELAESQEAQAMGNVLSLTDNEDLNVRVCQGWAEIVGADHVFRCLPADIDPPDEEEEQLTGHVVWPQLPPPSLISAELMRGESSIIQVAGEAVIAQRQTSPLLWFVDGSLSFDPIDVENVDDAETLHVLHLRREADYLARSLHPELITTLSVSDRNSLFESMVDLVTMVYPQVPREQVVRDLNESEAAFPSALGHGVAIPHTYVSGLTDRCCAIARLAEGVDFNAKDGELVRLVFLLLSPPGDPEGHLATLAEIARLVHDREMRDRLIAAQTPKQLIRIVDGLGYALR